MNAMVLRSNQGEDMKMDEKERWWEVAGPLKVGGSTWCGARGNKSLWDKPQFQILLFKELFNILSCPLKTLNCSAQMPVLRLKSLVPLQWPMAH